MSGKATPLAQAQPGPQATPPKVIPPGTLTTGVATTIVREEEPVTFAELVRFAIRQRRVIALACLVGVGLGALWALVLTRQEFEASATLVLMPSRVTSGLQPGLMSLQGVQRLSESDAVIYETVRQLVEDDYLRPGDPLPRVGEELRTRIYTSRREDETLAPIIELVSRAATAEAAAATSNIWAEKLLGFLRDLKGRGTTDNIELVETEYEKSKVKVEALDQEYLQAAEGFSSQLTEARIRWRREIDKAKLEFERRLVELRKEAEDRRVSFQLESMSEIEEFVRSKGFVVVEDGVEPTDGSGSGASRTQLDTGTAALLREIMRLRIQLAQTTEFVTLEKTISNDAVWQATILDQADVVSLENLPGVRLQDQEINSTYLELTERLLEIDSELAAKLTDESRDIVRKVTAGMEELQRRRSAGLTKLLAEQAQAVEELRTQGARKVETLRIQQDKEIENLARRMRKQLAHREQLATNARVHFSGLATKFSEAELARAGQQLADVSLAAHAALPRVPRPRWLAVKVLIGLCCGILLGLVGGLVRELGSQ